MQAFDALIGCLTVCRQAVMLFGTTMLAEELRHGILVPLFRPFERCAPGVITRIDLGTPCHEDDDNIDTTLLRGQV